MSEIDDQQSGAALHALVRGAWSVVFGAAFQDAFHAGRYAQPSAAQHGAMAKEFEQRIAQLITENGDPDAALSGVADFVHQVVRRVLGPAPIARHLN